MSATRNACQLIWSLCCTSISTMWVIFPIWLVVLSMFLTVLGLDSGFFFSLCLSASFGWMKFSVAPLSNSAFSSACLQSVNSETWVFIDLFLAIYTDCVEQARTKADTFKPLENPHPLLLLSWLAPVWLFHHQSFDDSGSDVWSWDLAGCCYNLGRCFARRAGGSVGIGSAYLGFLIRAGPCQVALFATLKAATFLSVLTLFFFSGGFSSRWYSCIHSIQVQGGSWVHGGHTPPCWFVWFVWFGFQGC